MPKPTLTPTPTRTFPEESPPPYVFPFSEEAEVPGEEEKDEVDETFRIDENNLPKQVKSEIETDKYGVEKQKIKMGDIPIIFVHENRITYMKGKPYTKSPNIYELLTNKNSKITWDDLNEEEKEKYGTLVVDSKVLYDSYKKNKKHEKFLLRDGKIWHNRFLYMDEKRLEHEIEKDHMKYILHNPNEKTTKETKELIRNKITKKRRKRSKYKIQLYYIAERP